MMSANSSPTRWRRPYRELSLAAFLVFLAFDAAAQSPGVPYVNPQQLAIPAIGNDLNNLILNVNQALGVSVAPNGIVTGPGVSTNNFVPTWSGTKGIKLATGLPVTVTAAPNSLVQLNGAGQLDTSIIPPTSNPIYRAAVQAATAAVLPNSPTYNNNGNGVGATLTAGSNVALTLDGYSVLLGDRVLIQTQAAPAQNGIYTETQVGTGAVPWILTRATDFNAPGLANIELGVSVVTINGTTNGNKAFFFNQETCIYPSFSSCIVGATAMTWALVQTQQSYTASTGISLSANNFTLSTISNNQILGNIAGSAAAPIGLTTTQLTALVNQFTTTLSGTVPGTASSTTNFLRADGTWNPIATLGNNQVLGNVSGVSAGASALTATQLTTLCNLATSALAGCVPSSGGGTTKFLRSDFTWTTTPTALGLQVCTSITGASYTLAYSGSLECGTGSDANGIIPVTGGGTLTINASSSSYFPPGTTWAVDVPISSAAAVIGLGVGASWGSEGTAPVVTNQVTVPGGTAVQIITDSAGAYVPIATNFGYSSFTQIGFPIANSAIVGGSGATGSVLAMNAGTLGYSTSAVSGDTVLRSTAGNQLIFQEGSGGAGLLLTTANAVNIYTTLNFPASNSGTASAIIAEDGFSTLALDTCNACYSSSAGAGDTVLRANNSQNLLLMVGGGAPQLNVAGSLVTLGVATTMSNATIKLTSLATGAANNTVCWASATGLLTVELNATTCTGSDERTKTSMTPINLKHSLDIVLASKPISFYFKPEAHQGDEYHFGFGAQTLARIAPELTESDAGGVPNRVKYNELIPITWAAIQQLQAEIWELQTRRPH